MNELNARGNGHGQRLRYPSQRNVHSMTESVQITKTNPWKTWLSDRVAELRQRESQIFLVLALVIGALTGLAVVAFIMLTERLGMRLYPMGGAPWRRVLFPVVGSLSIGYRSEEHTSELQSLRHLVCRLL